MKSTKKKIFIPTLFLMYVCVLVGFSSNVFADCIADCPDPSQGTCPAECRICMECTDPDDNPPDCSESACSWERVEYPFSGDINISNTDDDISPATYMISGQNALKMKGRNGSFRDIYIGKNSGGLAPPDSTNAYGNVFIGRNAGSEFVLGGVNTMVGDKAGESLTAGIHNTFIGSQAGGLACNTDYIGADSYVPCDPNDRSNTTYNTVVGSIAGQFIVADRNTFLGTESGRMVSTGRSNTLLGVNAGAGHDRTRPYYPIITGSYNIHIGTYTETARDDISSSIAIGNLTRIEDDHQVVIGSGEFYQLCNDAPPWQECQIIAVCPDPVPTGYTCDLRNAGLFKESYWGSGVTSVLPHSFSFNASGGEGTDVAGAELILAGGKSTGSANGGSIKFQTSPTGVAGSNLNALEDRMVIDSTGDVNISSTLTLDPGSSLYDTSPAIIIGDDSTDFTRSIRFVGNGGGSTETDCTVHYESSNEWIELGCGLNIDTGNVLRLSNRQSWISAPTAGTLLNVATNQLNLQSPTIYFTGTDAQGNPDDNSVKVGIGTSAPTEKLTVAGTIESTSGGIKFPDGTLQTTASGQGSTSASSAFYGYNAGAGSGGVNNTMIGSNAGYGNISGTDNVFIGYQAGFNETGSNRLYIANSSTSAPLIYGEFDNSTVDINGDLYITGNAYMTSDARLKEDIKSIDSSLQKVMNIRGVSYAWKNDQSGESRFNEGRHYGVIGQEVAKVLPEIINKNEQGEIKVAYIELIPVLIEAIKEQQKIIEDQQKINTELYEKVNNLEREMKVNGTLASTDTYLY